MFLVLHLAYTVLIEPVHLLNSSIFVIERAHKTFFNRVTDLINIAKTSPNSIIEIFL